MTAILSERIVDALNSFHLPVPIVMPYITAAKRLVLREIAFDEVDGLLCEGRRLMYALLRDGPPLRRYYRLPRTPADLENEKICLLHMCPTSSKITVEWVPFTHFFSA